MIKERSVHESMSDDEHIHSLSAFVALKPAFASDKSKENDLIKELTLQVRKTIGPFATPKRIVIVEDLPKTRSGKVSEWS